MYIAAFLLGLTGSLHCVGMCGPIASMVQGTTGKKILINRLLYNIGRTTTYVLMGVAVGLLGKIVQWGGVQGKVSIAVGAAIILTLFIPNVQSVFLPSLSRIVLKLKGVFAVHMNSKRAVSSWLTGMFNGFLPCGLVYAALAIALIQTTPLQSALVTMLFGLGTIPALLAAAFSWQALRRVIPWSFQRIQTAMLIVVAVVMIWRGLSVETNFFGGNAAEVVCHP
ncbi:MAG TPA: sulfite exporter TauE/SafE family protein [Cyclobacteriaceae bacterium]|mgnify:CR=1 FL=1|nr:sulfite exporter TauE/SafE family protein [Cyclobacteriaceae bacterium]HRJ82818.1 sulfite exporter TauE/SafE family protein [Cyclobacteriaceae bacterium]